MDEAQIEKLISHHGKLAVGGAPEGYQPLVLADLARRDGGRCGGGVGREPARR